VGDAGHLARIQLAPRMDVEHDRGGGLLVIAHEPGLLRYGQMHARTLHCGKRLYGACQFALQGALEIDLLDKLGHAELLCFHQFKAGHAALGQALRGQPHAQFMHLLLRHQDGAARLGKFVGRIHLLQCGDDVAAIPLGDVGKQH